MSTSRLPFVGSEALANGVVTKYELRARYKSVFPDVYLPADEDLTLRRRAIAGWLWSHREGVIAGLTASALHGAKWVDVCTPIELVWSNARRPPGLRTFDYRLMADELVIAEGMRMTALSRTAFDIGRRGSLNEAVARLDALGNATGLRAEDVFQVAGRHRGARGLRQLSTALDLYDPGAQSPKETWLRLLLIEAGYPRPQTQIPVLGLDGHPLYFLDMGWEDATIAVEYDGDDHRQRQRFGRDLVRSEFVAYRGWTLIRVMADHRKADILRRVQRAWASKLR